jgi:hypothetical protein
MAEICHCDCCDWRSYIGCTRAHVRAGARNTGNISGSVTRVTLSRSNHPEKESATPHCKPSPTIYIANRRPTTILAMCRNGETARGLMQARHANEHTKTLQYIAGAT